MKVPQKEIAGALVALGKLVCRTSPVEVYRCIQIDAASTQTQFRTQNVDKTLDFVIDAENPVPWQAVVNFDDFRSAVRGCKTKSVELELTDGKLAVDHAQIPFAYDEGREVSVPDEAKATLLPEGFVRMLASAVTVIDRSDYRRILRGVHICKEGFVATNGKEMINIAVPLKADDLTVPFPSGILATRSEASGTMRVWKDDSENCFQIRTGNWTWTAKSVDGTYPCWRRVIPDESALPHTAELNIEQAARLTTFLKAIPANPPNNQVDLTQGADGKTLMVKSDCGMCTGIEATFAAPWGEASLSVNRDMLVRALQQGHRRIAFGDGGPFTVTGGIGQYVAMPLFVHKQAQPKEEETKMSEVKTSVVAAPVPPVVINREPEVAINPLDELSSAIDDFKSRIRAMFEESSALSRKVKEVALAQKQKERDFIQAKRAIERIRMAI